MNKELEAINRLEAIIEDEWIGIDTWLKNDLPIIKRLIVRTTIPQRVMIVETKHSTDGSATHIDKLCPNCNESVYFDTNYCSKCGTRIAKGE